MAFPVGRRAIVRDTGSSTAVQKRSFGDDERDAQLLARVAARDREAFRQLFQLYHRRLAGFLTRLTRRHDLAEEIISDTLWVVWRKAPEFRGGSRVSKIGRARVGKECRSRGVK